MRMFLAASLIFGSLIFNPAALAEPPAIEVKNAWIRAVPPGSKATAGFAVILNHGAEPVTLTAGKSALAAEVKPMVTTRKTINGQEVAGMEFVPALTIPPKSRLVLEPGGDHLMFLQLKEIPRAGTEIPVTLSMGDQSITIPFEVRKK